jgi:uncharacterized membrane protein
VLIVDEIFFAFVILAGGVLVVAPLIALFLVVELRKRSKRFERQIAELEQRGARADWWIGELARRASSVVAPTETIGEAPADAGAAAPRQAGATEATAIFARAPTTRGADVGRRETVRSDLERPVVPGVHAAPPPASNVEPTSIDAQTAAGSAGHTDASGASPPEMGPGAAPTAYPSHGRDAENTLPSAAHLKKPFDFEKLVGVRLFAWLGGIGLFIGAAFFLEYSIEHDLISPPLRIGIGLLTGALAILVGDLIRNKADRAGQALGGAGIATLYASLFAARSLYELLPMSATFAAMALVTAVAGVIAVRRDAFMLAVIGLVGGFATPVLLSTGEDHRYALFGYIGLLDAGVLFVAAKRKWMALTAMAFVGSGLIYAAWAMEYLDEGGVPFALAIAALFAALFAVGSLNRTAEAPAASPFRTGLFATALAAPFIAAFSMGTQTDLHASAPLLAGYLGVLLAGTFVMAEKWGAPFSLEVSAGLAVLTLVGRIAPDVFGNDERLKTLLAFSFPPLVLLGLCLVRHRRAGAPMAASLRRAAGIALFGSLLVVSEAVTLEGPTSAIAPFAFYVAAHVAGLIAIGLIVPSPRWHAFAQALWIATLLVLGQGYNADRLNEYLPFILGPMLLFFGLPLMTGRARAEPVGWIAAAVSLVTHYAILYGLARNVWPDIGLGAGALVSATLALGMLAFARPLVVQPAPSAVIATIGAVTLAFLAAAVPITLSKQWITVAWGLEAAALAWLFLRIRHNGLIVGSALLSTFTLVRLVANPSLWEYHPRSGIIVFNWYLYTFGLPALCFFATAYLLAREDVAKKYWYPPALWFAGGAVIFMLLNVEIADAYSTGQTIGFHMGASLGEDMTYSLGWGVFGLLTLVLGMVVRSTRARLSALAVLLLTIGKVFLHDLWHLGALYRVGSMVGLAMALLAVSFLTQRFILRGDRT